MVDLGTLSLAGMGGLALSDLGEMWLGLYDTDGIPMYVCGAYNPLTSHVPLVLPGPFMVHTYQQRMFLSAPPLLNAVMPMFLKATSTVVSSSIGMYVNNNCSSAGLPMAVYSAGLFPGYYPANENLPMYVYTTNILGSIQLFCCTQDIINGFCPMYLQWGDTGTLPMVMPHVDYSWTDGINGYIPMYLGGGILNDGIPLYILNTHDINAYIPMFAYNNFINSTMKMFTLSKGNPLVTSIRMMLPDVTVPSKLSVPLYIHGY